MAHHDPPQDTTLPEPHASRGMWQSFTGLFPLVFSVPILIFRLWAVGIVVGIITSVCVIVFHLKQRQGVTALDIGTLLFGLVNAVLYFGFGNTFLVSHLDVLIYTLLFGQVAIMQLRGEAWTTQYAKRSVSPDVWETRAFREANRFSSLVWGAAFLLCDLAALFGPVALIRLYLPIALLVVTAVATPRLSQWRARQFIAA